MPFGRAALFPPSLKTDTREKYGRFFSAGRTRVERARGALSWWRPVSREASCSPVCQLHIHPVNFPLPFPLTADNEFVGLRLGRVHARTPSRRATPARRSSRVWNVWDACDVASRARLTADTRVELLRGPLNRSRGRVTTFTRMTQRRTRAEPTNEAFKFFSRPRLVSCRFAPFKSPSCIIGAIYLPPMPALRDRVYITLSHQNEIAKFDRVFRWDASVRGLFSRAPSSVCRFAFSPGPVELWG